jgi:hypothetical protein
MIRNYDKQMLYLVYSPFLIMTDKDQKEKSVGG